MSTQTASQTIAEYFQSPDDLLKIQAFRKKLAKEKASIDAKLKSGVKDQLDATKEGLKKLIGTRNNVQAIKDEMSAMDKMCAERANQIKTFDQISRVSIVHRNFALTEEMVNNLSDMYSQLSVLESHLAQDMANPLGPAPNLLAIHYQLNQLESFRNQTMHQAKRATADARNTLTRHFERLNKVLVDFDEYIMLLAKNVLPLARAGNRGAIVKLIKIAEIEGREDEKAIAIKLVKKVANMQDAAAKFKSMQANARILKLYRSKIMSTITQSIKDSFAEAYHNASNNPLTFLENLGWMYQDIIRIEDDIVPCFPPDYEILSFYVKRYHKALDDTIRTILAAEPEATVLLAIHAWTKQYKKDMKELEIPPALLEPPILDGKEQSLIDDYVKLIITKLDEWTKTLMYDETREFTARENPPEVDAEGQYGMQGSVILFQMVNQQVDLAVESGQGAVLAKVVTECNRVMRGTQDQWAKLVDSELKKMIDRPDEAPRGLVEYVMALANDQIKSADYAESLSTRLEPLVSDKYKKVINERLNDSMDGYLDVAKKCTQALVDIIFNDLKPATKQLFTTPTWYDGIPMAQIVETMKDYMADYQSYLNPSILEILIGDLIDTFLITYLTTLRKCSKLRMPDAAARMKEDISSMFELFSSYRPPNELEQYFEVMDQIHGMLTASKGLVFLSFWPFAKQHGPNVPFVESLMRARDDLDRTAVSEVMESVRRKVKDEGLTDPPEPTIMKKIAVQSALATFLSRS